MDNQKITIFSHIPCEYKNEEYAAVLKQEAYSDFSDFEKVIDRYRPW